MEQPHTASSRRLQRVRETAARLPKAQLHLHLDGSLSEGFIARCSAARGVTLPCDEARLREHLVASKQRDVANDKFVQQANGNWSQFDFCNQFLQTKEQLCSATRELVSHLVAQNVWVVEVRFCPLLHVHERLRADEAVAAVVEGYERARNDARACLPCGLKGGVILCALRSHDEQKVVHVCKLAENWLHRGVVGLDIAGDERSYPLQLHASHLQAAHQNGVPLTLHAGECAFEGARENVSLALRIGAERIGHGLVLSSSEDLCRDMRGVFLETCLTANCSGGYKIAADRYDLHPIQTLLERGVRVAGFNIDNLLLSGTVSNRADAVEEIVRARMHCQLSWEQIAQVLVDGARASFDDSLRSSKGECEFLTQFEQTVNSIVKPLKNNDDF
ncbi:adenosine deaminase [Gracilaria domingensis]|nr:adenosine deaminase [Gracilaria domingensis]